MLVLTSLQPTKHCACREKGKISHTSGVGKVCVFNLKMAKKYFFFNFSADLARPETKTPFNDINKFLFTTLKGPVMVKVNFGFSVSDTKQVKNIFDCKHLCFQRFDGTHPQHLPLDPQYVVM